MRKVLYLTFVLALFLTKNVLALNLAEQGQTHASLPKYVTINSPVESHPEYPVVWISFDGNSWESVTNKSVDALRNYKFSNIVYGRGKFVAIGSSLDGSQYAFASSADGVNWKVVPSRYNFSNITFGGMDVNQAKFIASTMTNYTIAYSTDGENWTYQNIILKYPQAQVLVFPQYIIGKINTNFAAYGLGDGSAFFLTSADGINWSVPDYASSYPFPYDTYKQFYHYAIYDINTWRGIAVGANGLVTGIRGLSAIHNTTFESYIQDENINLTSVAAFNGKFYISGFNSSDNKGEIFLLNNPGDQSDAWNKNILYTTNPNAGISKIVSNSSNLIASVADNTNNQYYIIFSSDGHNWQKTLNLPSEATALVAIDRNNN